MTNSWDQFCLSSLLLDELEPWLAFGGIGENFVHPSGFMDEETEARVLRNLSEMRNRTCIIVTHRKAALAICDQTLRMEDGRLV